MGDARELVGYFLPPAQLMKRRRRLRPHEIRRDQPLFGVPGKTPKGVRTLTEAEQLIQAADIGDLKRVKYLLGRGVNVNVHDGSDKMTALLSATATAHPEVVDYLLNSGADVNAQDKDGRTPLLAASAQEMKIGYVNSDLRRPQNDNNSYGVVSASMLGGAADCSPGQTRFHPGLR